MLLHEQKLNKSLSTVHLIKSAIIQNKIVVLISK